MTATTPPALGSIAQTNPARVYMHRAGRSRLRACSIQSTDVVGYLFESQLSAYFPWDALETHFGILQPENPTYIRWDFDPASPNPVQLSQFALTTGDEFPGEGPTDTSP
jgi:hypothetical protein